MLTHVFPHYTKNQKYSEKLNKLSEMLKTIYEDKMHVGEKFEVTLAYYIPLLKEKYDDWHIRLNDLETLRQISMRYGSLDELLEDFAIEPPERGVWRVEPETKEEEKPLTLSTMHSAKGLEWDTVFIMNLVDGILPITFSLDSEDEIEEEHRLFYVAITRAKNRLFLTVHHEGTRGGITQFNKFSRFVDIPNVFAKLDVEDTSKPIRKEISQREAKETPSLYDKKSLLERIIRFYK
jgi:DNA helicase-2/ATP-dependent DNA helicase PcrA